MKRILFFVIVLLFVIDGCRRNTASVMVFDDIEYVRSFPETLSLPEGDEVRIDKIGIQDLRLYDTLMLVSSKDADGFVSVFGLTGLKELGKMFYRGNGPGELLSPPFFSMMQIVHRDSLDVALLNDGRGHLLGWDIRESCDDPDIVIFKDSIPMDAFYSLYINDSTFLCRVINGDERGQTRFLDVGGEKKTTPPMETLNKASIPGPGEGYFFNIMSSLSGYNYQNGVVVEASLMLNTINMYTLDGSFEKTVCIGKKVDNIDDVYRSGFRGMKDTFICLRMYEDFFAVMYSGGRMFGLGPSGTARPKIYLFDWSGSPISEIVLPARAHCFDFDMKNNMLYALDREDETVYAYNMVHYFFI